jgi:hypothetical protein
MMAFALKYRAAIDGITADKSLKMRKYELDSEDWQIVEDLVTVLEARHAIYHVCSPSNLLIAIYKSYTLFFEGLGKHHSYDSRHGQTH